MSFAAMSAASNAASLAAFGEEFVLDDGSPVGNPVRGIYDGPFAPQNAGGLNMESYDPTVRLLEASAAGLAHGTTITRTLTGQAYTVFGLQPDGHGWVVVILSED